MKTVGFVTTHEECATVDTVIAPQAEDIVFPTFEINLSNHSYDATLNEVISNAAELVFAALLLTLLIRLVYEYRKTQTDHSVFGLFWLASFLLTTILGSATMGLHIMREDIRAGEFRAVINLVDSSSPAYALLADWGLWLANPTPMIREYALTSGVVSELHRAEDEAAPIAKRMSATDEAIDLALLGAPKEVAAAAYANGARFYAQRQRFEFAIDLASRARRAAPDTDTYKLVRILFALAATASATNGEFETAIEYLDQMNIWSNDLFLGTVAYVSRSHLAHELSAGNFERSAALAEAYDKRATRYRVFGPLSMQCDRTLTLELLAAQHLINNRPHKAVTALNTARSLFVDSPATQKMLPQAYLALGLTHLANDQPGKAIDALTNGLTHTPDDEELSCTLSDAHLAQALQYSMRNEFEASRTSIASARNRCPKIEWQLHQDVVDLQLAEHSLRHGRFDTATYALRSATSSNNADLAKTAELYLNDVPRARSRMRKLSNARRWVANIPPATGSMCFIEDLQCSAVLIFNGDEPVGEAPQGFNEVTFPSSDSSNTWLFDAFGTNNFSVWNTHIESTEHVYIDQDNDQRPDRYVHYQAGIAAYQKQLSGRIEVSVPSVVVSSRNADIFSAPDLFLVATYNGIFYGKTSVVDNNRFAGWRDLYVIDYTYQSRLVLSLLDEDVFSNELIEEFRIDSLPSSGIMIGKSSAIEISVTHGSERIPGHYRPDDAQRLPNLFLAPQALEHSKELSRIVREASDRQAKDDAAALALSLTLPELISIAAKASISESLIVSLVGFQILEALLRSNDIES